MQNSTGERPEDEIILKNESLRQYYRSHIAEALVMCRKYKGDQEQDKRLLEKLEAIEKWLIETFHRQEAQGAFPKALEENIANVWLGTDRRRRTIDSLLEMSGEYYDRFLTRALDNPENGLLQLTLDEIILPPGEGPGILEGDGLNAMEAPAFQERLKDLLSALKDSGIYSDDVILVRGKLSGREMRQLSYVIVEIPKLGKEVLVNDQVGEATFVIDGIMSRRYLATVSKAQLLDKHSNQVLRVVYKNKGYWLLEIMKYLLKDVQHPASLEKINVSQQEYWKQELLKWCSTAEEWSKMEKDKKKEKISDSNGVPRGLTYISTQFGIQGSPENNREPFLALGKAVYGHEHECLHELTAEYAKQWILDQYPTAEHWATMDPRTKIDFEIKGIGLVGIATLFGMIKANPIAYKKDFLELGKHIYGSDHEHLRVLDVDFLKPKILFVYPDPQAWIKMTTIQKGHFGEDIGVDLSMKLASTVFGINGNPLKHKDAFLAFGRAIFGEEHECLQDERRKGVQLDIENLTPEATRLAVKKVYATAQQWREMTQAQKKAFKNDVGIGFHSLAKIFAVEGDRSSTFLFLAIGREIFGDEECLKEPNKAYFINWFRQNSEALSSGRFSGITPSLKVNGYTLDWISTQFGITGKPTKDADARAALEREILQELSVLQHS